MPPSLDILLLRFEAGYICFRWGREKTSICVELSSWHGNGGNNDTGRIEKLQPCLHASWAEWTRVFTPCFILVLGGGDCTRDLTSFHPGVFLRQLQQTLLTFEFWSFIPISWSSARRFTINGFISLYRTNVLVALQSNLAGASKLKRISASITMRLPCKETTLTIYATVKTWHTTRLVESFVGNWLIWQNRRVVMASIISRLLNGHEVVLFEVNVCERISLEPLIGWKWRYL